jgi:hypothetical protein
MDNDPKKLDDNNLYPDAERIKKLVDFDDTDVTPEQVSNLRERPEFDAKAGPHLYFLAHATIKLDSGKIDDLRDPENLKKFRAVKDYAASDEKHAKYVQGKWDEFVQRRKEHADNHALKMFLKEVDEYVDTSSAPELTEEYYWKNGWGNGSDEIVTNINNFYGKIIVKGRFFVLHKKTNGEVEFMERKAFVSNFEDRRVMQGEKLIDIGTLWLKAKEAWRWDEFIFDPNRPYVKGSKTLNLYDGLGTKSVKGHCYKFLHHLRWMVCKGDKQLYRYLLTFLAQIVQQPGIKPGIALALVGKRGAGKSLIGETMGRLISGPDNRLGYYVQTADQNHIFGNHNDHMAKALLLQDEEATWAGDVRAEKKLNNFITAPTLLVNPKNLPAIQMKNFTRIFIIANDGWSVPTSWEDERRYFILYVSNNRCGDIPYFKAIHDALDNGGYEALMYFLMHYDISKIDLRIAPVTEGLIDQKIESLTGMPAWLFDIIKSGDAPIYRENDDGSIHIIRNKFRYDFGVFQNRMPGKGRSTETKFGRDLHRFFDDLSKYGERDIKGGVVPLLRISTSSNQVTGTVPTYVLGSLPAIRRALNTMLKRDLDWGEGWEHENWKMRKIYNPLMDMMVDDPGF